MILTAMCLKLRVLALIFFLTTDVLPIYAVNTKLAAPRNVKVNSFNMGVVLVWTSPHNSTSDVTYTARHVLAKKKISYLCNNTKDLECDAGKLPFAYGGYVYQVRAERKGLFSAWVNTSVFTPYTDTIIGPPTVRLVIRDNSLDVHVQEPELKVFTFTTVYTNVSYVIRYWIEGFEDAVTQKESNRAEEVKLSIKGLNLWSRYCAEARVKPRSYRKETLFSSAVCVINIPVATSCLIAALLLLPLVILTSWLTCKGKKFLYPKIKLPDHFYKFFLQPPVSTCLTVIETTPFTTHQKEQHDRIIDISEDCLHEEPSDKTKNSEDKEAEIPPIQEVEDDYQLLMQMKPSANFYPNHLYPLCMKNTLFTHMNQPHFGCCTDSQPFYCNLVTSSDLKHNNNCVL